MAEFAAQLDPINALTDDSPGFVWRLQTEEDAAAAIRAFDDERILFDLPVWASIDALFQYVYKSGHLQPLSNRYQWFEKSEGPPLALWWIPALHEPAAHEPTVEEAKQPLKHLKEHGPTAEAFTFTQNFPPPG